MFSNSGFLWPHKSRLCSVSLVSSLQPVSPNYVDYKAVLAWDPVNDSFKFPVMFFCYRLCLHQEGPSDGGHCTEGRADVCPAQYPSDSVAHPLDVGNCDSSDRGPV